MIHRVVILNRSVISVILVNMRNLLNVISEFEPIEVSAGGFGLRWLYLQLKYRC